MDSCGRERWSRTKKEGAQEWGGSWGGRAVKASPLRGAGMEGRGKMCGKGCLPVSEQRAPWWPGSLGTL